MIATQDNILVIDFDTYVFHPGEPIIYTLCDPFYIDYSQMHDLDQDHTVEQNTCGKFIVREDTVQWNSQDVFKIANGNIYDRYTFPYNTNDSATIIKNIIAKEFPGFGVYSDDQLVCCYTQGNAEPNPCMSGDTTVNSSIFYTSVTYNYQTSYTFPLTRSISLFMSSTDLPVYTIPQSFDMSINSSVFTIQQGDYTAKTFHNTLFESIKDIITEYGRNNIETTNKYIYIDRFYAPELKFLSNEQFDSYYNKLHTFHTYPSIDAAKYVRFPTSLYPTFRSLSIPSGEYTKDSLVNYINTHTTLFTAEAIDNTIYIKADKPFIFNPSMTLHDTSTDFSENFATSHVLCTVAQEEETINTQFKDLTTSTDYTLQGTYTPATLLRHLHELTSASFNIFFHDTNIYTTQRDYNVFTCDHIFDLDCPYFKFTDECLIGGYKVINKVNVDRMQMNNEFTSNNMYVQTDINKYTLLSLNGISTYDHTMVHFSDNESRLMYNKRDNQYYTTTTGTMLCSKLSNSCGEILSLGYTWYTHVLGSMRVNCGEPGWYTYRLQELYNNNYYDYKFYAPSSGTYDICINSPAMFAMFEVFILVYGNVDCDFSNVIAELNNNSFYVYKMIE